MTAMDRTKGVIRTLAGLLGGTDSRIHTKKEWHPLGHLMANYSWNIVTILSILKQQ